MILRGPKNFTCEWISFLARPGIGELINTKSATRLSFFRQTVGIRTRAAPGKGDSHLINPGLRRLKGNESQVGERQEKIRF